MAFRIVTGHVLADKPDTECTAAIIELRGTSDFTAFVPICSMEWDAHETWEDIKGQIANTVKDMLPYKEALADNGKYPICVMAGWTNKQIIDHSGEAAKLFGEISCIFASMEVMNRLKTNFLEWAEKIKKVDESDE